MEKKKVVYVSGKMKGLQKEDVIRNFNEAESFLRESGHEVVTPLPIYLASIEDSSKTYDDCLAEAIKLELPCDAVFMLSDWIDSKGARVEYAIAVEMKKEIIFQSYVSTPENVGFNEEYDKLIKERDETEKVLVDTVCALDDEKVIDALTKYQSARNVLSMFELILTEQVRTEIEVYTETLKRVTDSPVAPTN